MPDEVGPPKGVATPNFSFALSTNRASQATKRARTSRNARARACAAMRSRMTRWAKKSRVKLMYLVATRMRRPWVLRKAVATKYINLTRDFFAQHGIID